MPRSLRRWLPPGTAPHARRLLAARALRGFGDGLVSVLLPVYLAALGFDPPQIGLFATTTLLGSAALTLAVGLLGGRLAPRSVLLWASLAMLATGVATAFTTGFWPLLLVALAGTLNPSAGDVSVFLPTEQALLAEAGPDAQRTALFARYNLGGALLGALGAFAAGTPEALGAALGLAPLDALRGVFLGYAALAVAVGALYLGLPARVPARREGAPLGESRRVVLELTGLFSLDSFGGGFVVQSMLAVWLLQRYDLSLPSLGGAFAAMAALSAVSQLASPLLAARIGLVRTMAYTHVPANLFLIAAAFMPDAGLAIGCLLGRMAFSQMDVPARQALVMSLVPAAERPAAASVTNVPRSLASALSPFLAGALLGHSAFGWPLVLGGAAKLVYDGLLIWRFRGIERHAARPR